MYCRFLEHTFLDTKTMAQLHQLTEELNLTENLEEAMLLATCHRIEIFSLVPIPPTPFRDAFGYDGYAVAGKGEVYRRMLEIACGLRSQVLGEKLIAKQFEQAVDSMPSGQPLWVTGKAAARAAEKLRQKFGFFAQLDYEELVFHNLAVDEDRSLPGEGRSLLIIGSGMLAQAVTLRAPHFGYNKVAMVSRVPKQVRKRESALARVGRVQG